MTVLNRLSRLLTITNNVYLITGLQCKAINSVYGSCNSLTYLSLAGQTLLPKEGPRKSLVKAVLCTCTAWPYLDAALRFDQQLCFFLWTGILTVNVPSKLRPGGRKRVNELRRGGGGERNSTSCPVGRELRPTV